VPRPKLPVTTTFPLASWPTQYDESLSAPPAEMVHWGTPSCVSLVRKMSFDPWPVSVTGPNLAVTLYRPVT
jgi:hypothetical protein